MTYGHLHFNRAEYKNLRKKLRLGATKAEKVLWQELKDKKLGYKFRRQFQIDCFIVDFYCHKLRLVIELDGPIHELQKEYDEERTKEIEKRGLVVIRYLNDYILFERETLISELRTVLRNRASELRLPTLPVLP